jgi:hypothetical protein
MANRGGLYSPCGKKTNLCEVIRTFTIGFLMTFVLGFLFAGITFLMLAGPLSTVILWFTEGLVFFDDIWIFPFVLLLSALILGLVYLVTKVDRVIPENVHEVYRAYKDKYCPVVEIVE